MGTRLRFLGDRFAETVLGFVALVHAAAGDAEAAAFAGLAVDVWVARTFDLADSVAAETASRTAVVSLDYFPVWSGRALGLAFARGLADSTAKR